MDSINLVKEFHEVFGHHIAPEPDLPDYKTMHFRTSFIMEELLEVGQAHDKSDLIELADGLGDIQYVLDGWFLNAGLHDKKDAIMAEIHRSNMSKVCKSFEEGEQTIARLRQLNAIESYHIERCRKVGLDNYYVVYRTIDRKVMKSINYFKPDLKPIIYG